MINIPICFLLPRKTIHDSSKGDSKQARHPVLQHGNSALMLGTLIYGANHKERNKLYMSGSKSFGRKKEKTKQDFYLKLP